jgi:hypothetical protein
MKKRQIAAGAMVKKKSARRLITLGTAGPGNETEG